MQPTSLPRWPPRLATFVSFEKVREAFLYAGFNEEGTGKFVYRDGDGTCSFILSPAPDGNVNVTNILEDMATQMPLLDITVRDWLARNI